MPLPWAGNEPPFGFSPAGAQHEPWLPQPKEWRDLTVAAEQASQDSMLCLYTEGLRIRRSLEAFRTGDLTWQEAPDGVLSFRRGTAVRCIANLSPAAVDLPPGAELLLASGPLAGGQLPTDTTAWLRG